MMMMAMGGEAAAAARRGHFNPTVEIPAPWSPLEDPTALGALGMGMGMGLSPSGEYAAYLVGEEGEVDAEEEAEDVYAGDEFRMYEFKVRRCARGRSHDWTECPFAHPGEKARRRDPRKYHYSGTACPDFRKGSCKRGDACEFAHGVFECWLHPARYRTQPCKDGTACRRPVCFFAHTFSQLRLPLPLPYHSAAACCPANKTRRRRSMKQKRTSFSSPPTSPVFSPAGSREEVEAAMAELRLCKSMPSSWKYRSNAAGFESSGSRGLLPSTAIVMAPEQQQHYSSWHAEESAEEEMSAPNFDWVSDLLK